MENSLNVYTRWLDIAADKPAPNHYELLGLYNFEADADRISAAFETRYRRVRSYQVGQFSDTAQRLLDELSDAYKCLTNPHEKEAYDRQLKQAIQQRTTVVDDQSAADSRVDLPAVPPPLPASKRRGKSRSLDQQKRTAHGDQATGQPESAAGRSSAHETEDGAVPVRRRLPNVWAAVTATLGSLRRCGAKRRWMVSVWFGVKRVGVAVWRELGWLLHKIDGGLRWLAGTGNTILHYFVRVLAAIVGPLALLAAGWIAAVWTVDYRTAESIRPTPKLPGIVIQEGAPLELNFAEQQTGDGTGHHFEFADTAPAGATIDPETGVFRWTPTEGQAPGDYIISVRVAWRGNDGSGSAAEIPLSVSVRATDGAPLGADENAGTSTGASSGQASAAKQRPPQREDRTQTVFDVLGGDAASEEPEVKAGQPPKRFAVYTEQNSPDNHFYPSGKLGDYADISFDDGHSDNCHSGTTCIKITYTGRASQGARFAGMYWQNPRNNWGNRPGGYDLTGTERLSFWARGERGGERVSEFKIGGITGEYSDSDVASIGPVVLTQHWQRYVIGLQGADLSSISGGFAWAANLDDNPQGLTFYLDDVVYEPVPQGEE